MKFNVQCASGNLMDYIGEYLLPYNPTFFTLKPFGFVPCTYAIVELKSLEDLVNLQKAVGLECLIAGQSITFLDEYNDVDDFDDW